MTQDSGAVGLRVQVPVLGTVSGTRSLADIAANKPSAPAATEPAVATRDIDGPAPTVKPAPGVAIAPKPKHTPPAPKPPANTTEPPKPAKPPVTAANNEDRAKRLLQLADNYLHAGLKSSAIGKLKEVIRKYPKTNAAETAEDKLLNLGVE